MTEFTLHSLVYLRQIEDILGCILDHISGQWSLFPEIIMFSHNHSNLLLFSVSYINIMLKQVCQRNVIVFTVNQFWCPLYCLLNNSVSDLSIKHEVAEYIELISER